MEAGMQGSAFAISRPRSASERKRPSSFPDEGEDGSRSRAPLRRTVRRVRRSETRRGRRRRDRRLSIYVPGCTRARWADVPLWCPRSRGKRLGSGGNGGGGIILSWLHRRPCEPHRWTRRSCSRLSRHGGAGGRDDAGAHLWRYSCFRSGNVDVDPIARIGLRLSTHAGLSVHTNV